MRKAYNRENSDAILIYRYAKKAAIPAHDPGRELGERRRSSQGLAHAGSGRIADKHETRRCHTPKGRTAGCAASPGFAVQIVARTGGVRGRRRRRLADPFDRPGDAIPDGVSDSGN